MHEFDDVIIMKEGERSMAKCHQAHQLLEQGFIWLDSIQTVPSKDEVPPGVLFLEARKRAIIRIAEQLVTALLGKEYGIVKGDLREQEGDATLREAMDVLKIFAAMHREGGRPDEVACVRGTASDMTMLTSADFERAHAFLAQANRDR